MISLRHVEKWYGPTCALDDVSLEIPPGSIFGLIGPNGAGKTTILRIVSGLVQPTAGEVQVAGAGAAPRGAESVRVGYLPQRAGFSGLATPREVLHLFARLHRLPASAAGSALEEAGLADAADRELRTLSGGTRQRLGLAVACLGEPDVLLLDEPGAGLDPRAAIELRQRVRRLSARGRTIVMASHSLPELETICDRLAMLVAGRVVVLGTVAELRSHAGGASLEELFLEATA